jgi:hypothetical protein
VNRGPLLCCRKTGFAGQMPCEVVFGNSPGLPQPGGNFANVVQCIGDLATTDAATLSASKSFGFPLEPFFARSRSREAAMLT